MTSEYFKTENRGTSEISEYVTLIYVQGEI